MRNRTKTKTIFRRVRKYVYKLISVNINIIDSQLLFFITSKVSQIFHFDQNIFNPESLKSFIHINVILNIILPRSLHYWYASTFSYTVKRTIISLYLSIHFEFYTLHFLSTIAVEYLFSGPVMCSKGGVSERIKYKSCFV